MGSLQLLSPATSSWSCCMLRHSQQKVLMDAAPSPSCASRALKVFCGQRPAHGDKAVLHVVPGLTSFQPSSSWEEDSGSCSCSVSGSHGFLSHHCTCCEGCCLIWSSSLGDPEPLTAQSSCREGGHLLLPSASVRDPDTPAALDQKSFITSWQLHLTLSGRC